MTFASFHNVGNLLLLILLFMSNVIDIVMAGAAALNIQAVILSPPVDLPECRATSVLFMVCSVITGM